MTHVCLQMGHVPRTRGATGAPGEQAYARAVCSAAAALLRNGGHRVTIIGADDRVPRSDVFIAVHYDGSIHSSAYGASVGYRTGRATTARSRAMAHRWKAAYRRLGHRWGFRADNYTPALQGYYGTGRAHAAGTPVAFILEGGFGSHPQEGPWLRSQTGIYTCARAITEAVTGTATTPTQPDDLEAFMSSLSTEDRRNLEGFLRAIREKESSGYGYREVIDVTREMNDIVTLHDGERVSVARFLSESVKRIPKPGVTTLAQVVHAIFPRRGAWPGGPR